MGKILLIGLTAAAFLYAVWCVFVTRRLPTLQGRAGVSRRFHLATIVVAGFLVGCGNGRFLDDKSLSDATMSCYYRVQVQSPEEHRREQSARREMVTLRESLRAAWRTLDPAGDEQFRVLLAAAVETKQIHSDTAAVLDLVYIEMAEHRRRLGRVPTVSESSAEASASIGAQETHGASGAATSDGRIAPVPSCYEATAFQRYERVAREGVERQLTLLQAARDRGTLDAATVERVVGTLAIEIEQMSRIKPRNPDGRPVGVVGLTEMMLVEQLYQDGDLLPHAAAEQAARFITNLETMPETESNQNP